MNQLRWMRLFGDTTFAVGAVILGWFVLGLLTGHSYTHEGLVAPGEAGIEVRQVGD
jgi:nitric oxide reductase subunit B